MDGQKHLHPSAVISPTSENLVPSFASLRLDHLRSSACLLRVPPRAANGAGSSRLPLHLRRTGDDLHLPPCGSAPLPAIPEQIRCLSRPRLRFWSLPTNLFQERDRERGPPLGSRRVGTARCAPPPLFSDRSFVCAFSPAFFILSFFILRVPCAFHVVGEICLSQNLLILSCTIGIGTNLVRMSITVWCGLSNLLLPVPV